MSIELKIRDCFPEGQTRKEQFEKVIEELAEYKVEGLYQNKAKEAAHIAKASVGLALLTLRDLAERHGEKLTDEEIEEILQNELNRSHKEKREEWENEDLEV